MKVRLRTTLERDGAEIEVVVRGKVYPGQRATHDGPEESAEALVDSVRSNGVEFKTTPEEDRLLADRLMQSTF